MLIGKGRLLTKVTETYLLGSPSMRSKKEKCMTG